MVLEILIQDELEYCDSHQMIGLELKYEVMGVMLALNGRSIGAELGKIYTHS